MADKITQFVEELSFGILHESADPEKRTVRVCALAPCLSANNRYYSPKLVESAFGTLKGKRSFADHDYRDTKNLIGRIKNESFDKGKLYADIKISKAAGVAEDTWQKILDGTITDVSIAANGKTQPRKMGEKIVDEVTELEIHSVDFVPEGGVKGAKVMQVFENVSDIPQLTEVKETMEIKTIEELRATYPELVKQVEAPLAEKITTMENKINEEALAKHKSEEIAKLTVSEDIKKLIADRVTGKTVEEISASVKSELDLVTKVIEAAKKDAKIEGIPEVKPEVKKTDASTPWTTERIMKEEKIPEALKLASCEILVTEGSAKMISYLKSHKVEL
jgi:hypothetical protein